MPAKNKKETLRIVRSDDNATPYRILKTIQKNMWKSVFSYLSFWTFFGLILSYSSLLIIFVKKLKILLQIMRDNDDYKIKGKMKKFWRKKILFIRKQKQLKNNNNINNMCWATNS